jgi:hypothetical protein
VKKFLREIPLSIKTVFITLHHPLFARGPINIGISAEIFEMVGMLGRTAKLLIHPMLLWDKIYNGRYFSERFLANEKGMTCTSMIYCTKALSQYHEAPLRRDSGAQEGITNDSSDSRIRKIALAERCKRIAGN